MNKKLILFNGRGHGNKYLGYHFYIAAHSYVDAGHLLTEATRHSARDNWYRELKTYYSRGCWGDRMAGITPERGLWVHKDQSGERPVKVC